MKIINVLKYKNAQFKQLGKMDIVCEFNDFTDCVSQTVIPFRVTFSKEKCAWVYASLPQKDFSPFKSGAVLPEHLQSVMFDVAHKFETEFENSEDGEEQEIDTLINY